MNNNNNNNNSKINMTLTLQITVRQIKVYVNKKPKNTVTQVKKGLKELNIYELLIIIS